MEKLGIFWIATKTPHCITILNVCSYQGTGGISRGMFLVLHGASKPEAQFLPNMPPMTVNGKPTAQTNKKKFNTKFLMMGHTVYTVLLACIVVGLQLLHSTAPHV